MNAFILILTLWSNDMGGHATIHSIEMNERACHVAAKAWLESINNKSERKSAVCVKAIK